MKEKVQLDDMREEHNEQETIVERYPKVELVMLFLQEWDSGDLRACWRLYW